MRRERDCARTSAHFSRPSFFQRWVFYCNRRVVPKVTVPRKQFHLLHDRLYSATSTSRSARLRIEVAAPTVERATGSFRYSTSGRRTDCQTGSIVRYCDPSTCLLSLKLDQKSAQHAVDAVIRNLFGAYVRGLARILGAPAAP